MSVTSKPVPGAASPWANTLLELIDGIIQNRVLVYGSLPPDGGDLDLLARHAELRAIRDTLIAAGFIPVRRMLVRFQEGKREMVELTPADSWRLPSGELNALFAEGQPLGERQYLVQPSAHHALLIRARKIIGRNAAIPRVLGRTRALVAQHPDSWRRANDRAAAWHARRALRAMKYACEHDGRLTLVARWSALAEQLSAREARGVRGHVRILREFLPQALLPRLRRTRVITFSGLDGSGKTSQARLLRDALLATGQDAVVVWAGIGTNRSLGWIKAPVKRMLRALPRGGPFQEVIDRVTPKPDGRPTPLAEPGGEHRRHSRWFRITTQVWMAVMALVNVYSLRKVLLRSFGQGRIVIFDRYTLDSAVRLRHWYGDSLAYRLVIRLVHRLAKRPVRAYFLDVSPEVAFERKPEWELCDLKGRVKLYSEEYARLGVRRLDGTRPADELAAEIAADVWGALR